MAFNTIKIKQIDEPELLAFLAANLGLSLVPLTSTSHTYPETFNSTLTVLEQFTASGQSRFVGTSTFESGFYSNSGIRVNGIISGKSVAFESFNIPSGAIGSINIGSLHLTGVPIYESGDAGLGVLLQSGTIFGVKQIINAPAFERDISGQFMPTNYSGVNVVMLCVSIGS